LLFALTPPPFVVVVAVHVQYVVWLAVAAVLKIQFALTISMALSISEFLEKPAKHFIEPVLKVATPTEYEKWIPVVLGWAIKSFAMTFAWYVQSVVSAISSSLQGGLMMSRALYDLCVAHNYKFFGALPDNHEESKVDEVLSFVFAGLGFAFQVMNSFDVPFPLNLVLWPFGIAEYWIRWTVTSKK
jgi:hypothetical protein